MFAQESLQGSMGKNVLYDTMNREDLNWRKCTVAKRYRVAQQQTKPEMVSAIIQRALRAGILASYLLADA